MTPTTTTTTPKRPNLSSGPHWPGCRGLMASAFTAAALFSQGCGAGDGGSSPSSSSAPTASTDQAVPPAGGAAQADRQPADAAPSSGKPVFPRAGNGASSPINVGTLVADGATTETLSLFLPVPDGDIDDDSVVIVEYREAGAANWSQALDLYKNHRNDVAPYAGMIFGLRPDTGYEVRITVQDPDGVNGAAQQTLALRTRAVPPVVRALDNNTVRVAGSAELKAAVDKALPGQVILLAPGRYDGTLHVHRRNGTEKAPITIRGAEDFKSVVSGNAAQWAVKIEESSHIHIEQLAIRDAVVGIEIRDWSKTGRATAGNVIRRSGGVHGDSVPSGAANLSSSAAQP